MFSVSHAVLLASRSDKQKDPWIEIGSFKQFNVILRFGNLISRDTPLRLYNYKAFILPNLNYCSSVLQLWGALSICNRMGPRAIKD